MGDDSAFDDDVDYDGDGEPWGEESESERKEIIQSVFDGSTLDDTKDLIDDAVPDWLPSTLSEFKKLVTKIVSNKLLKPIFASIYRLGLTLITLVGVIFLGGDLQLGWSGEPPDISLPWPAKTLVTGDGGGYIGIADLPVWFASTMIDMFEPIGNAGLEPIRTFNDAVGAAASNAGIAGPPIVFGLQVLELAVGLYALSLVVQFVAGYVVPGLAGRLGAAVRRPLEVFR